MGKAAAGESISPASGTLTMLLRIWIAVVCVVGLQVGSMNAGDGAGVRRVRLSPVASKGGLATAVDWCVDGQRIVVLVAGDRELISYRIERNTVVDEKILPVNVPFSVWTMSCLDGEVVFVGEGKVARWRLGERDLRTWDVPWFLKDAAVTERGVYLMANDRVLEWRRGKDPAESALVYRLRGGDEEELGGLVADAQGDQLAVMVYGRAVEAPGGRQTLNRIIALETHGAELVPVGWYPSLGYLGGIAGGLVWQTEAELCRRWPGEILPEPGVFARDWRTGEVVAKWEGNAGEVETGRALVIVRTNSRYLRAWIDEKREIIDGGSGK